MSRKITDIARLNALFNQARDSASPEGGAGRQYASEPQTRLVLGPFQLVLATNAAKPRAGEAALWALPGGGRATTAQLLVVARRNAWKRPVQIQVTVRRLVPGDIRNFVSRETHGE